MNKLEVSVTRKTLMTAIFCGAAVIVIGMTALVVGIMHLKSDLAQQVMILEQEDSFKKTFGSSPHQRTEAGRNLVQRDVRRVTEERHCRVFWDRLMGRHGLLENSLQKAGEAIALAHRYGYAPLTSQDFPPGEQTMQRCLPWK